MGPGHQKQHPSKLLRLPRIADVCPARGCLWLSVRVIPALHESLVTLPPSALWKASFPSDPRAAFDAPEAVRAPSIQNNAEAALVGAAGAPGVQLSASVYQDVPGAQDNGLLVVFNDQLS